MVVRGDGALMSERLARTRPIETILSGPAASLVGAATLTKLHEAVVSDIGGTTTDIAVLEGGRPRLSPSGARVGGHRTLVEAVDMETVGLGGDSWARWRRDGTGLVLDLGPERALPLCRAATMFGAPILDALKASLAALRPTPEDGVFVMEAGETPKPFTDATGDRRTRAAVLRALVSGQMRRVAFTPTDALHVLGQHSAWHREAAMLGAALLARQRDGHGQAAVGSPEALAERVRTALVERSATTVLSAAFAADGATEAAAALAHPDVPFHTTLRAAMAGQRAAGVLTAGLGYPLVGLGAAAGAVYGDVAKTLNTEPVLP
ncbi:MAG: hydantoinase/oxoprolinase family protein, partial [Pseudomonadota bacterium]